jgi:hypothetical protein
MYKLVKVKLHIFNVQPSALQIIKLNVTKDEGLTSRDPTLIKKCAQETNFPLRKTQHERISKKFLKSIMHLANNVLRKVVDYGEKLTISVNCLQYLMFYT